MNNCKTCGKEIEKWKKFCSNQCVYESRKGVPRPEHSEKVRRALLGVKHTSERINNLKNKAMDKLTTLRLELNVNAQKLIQQVQVHNKNIEDEVSKGVQMALEEILSDGNFALKIKEQTMVTIEDIVSKAVFSWDVRQKITKMIEEKVGEKVKEYADKIAESVTSNLK